METYRLSASALLRLASLAAQAPNAGFGEILDILRGAQPDGVDTAEAISDADKPAKPE